MDLKPRLHFQQSIQCVKWAASGWMCGPGQMLVWLVHVGFYIPLWFLPLPFHHSGCCAGYMQAKAGCATVLWGALRGGICWEMLL